MHMPLPFSAAHNSHAMTIEKKYEELSIDARGLGLRAQEEIRASSTGGRQERVRCGSLCL